MAVGEHAELGGYLHAFQRDVLGPKIAVADEGSGGGEGVGSAAADGGDAVVGFDHVAGPSEHERMIPVGYKEHSLQLAEELVAPPVLGELHGGADQVAAGLFEVGVEAFEQGKGVRRGPGESGDDLIFICLLYTSPSPRDS